MFSYPKTVRALATLTPQMRGNIKAMQNPKEEDSNSGYTVQSIKQLTITVIWIYTLDY